MGLSTTAVHALWAVAILTGGGLFATTLLREVEETQQATEAHLARGTQRLASVPLFVDAVLQYPDGLVRLSFHNSGRTVLDPTASTVLFDGVPVALDAWEVDGVDGTTVWPPGAFANLTVVAPWEPRRIAGSFGAGAAFVWENTQPPYFVGLEVAPDPASVEFLATEQFTAYGTDQYGEPYATTGNVTWTSDLADTTIDEDGLFTAGRTAGVGTVTATQNDVVGTASVTVYRLPPVLTSMTLSPSSASVEFRATQTFTPTCIDQYGLAMACPSLDWSTTVAGSSVDASGVFAAGTTVASGEVVAAKDGVSASADVDVYRNPAVLTTILVAPASASVEFQDTAQFSASCEDQYALAMPCPALTWSTTVPGSSVSGTGLFTAGTTAATGVVRAASGGVSGDAEVEVWRAAPVLTAIAVTPDPANVEFLATQQFSAACTDQYALAMTCPTLVWSTSVAGSSVSSNGLFTAGTTAASGTVAATNGGVSDAASVTVYRNAAVLTGIAVSPGSASVQATKTQQFAATCTDQYALTMACPSLTWSTTTAAASVSSSGLFTAGTTLSTGGVVRAQSGGVSGTAQADVVALQVKIEWIRMYTGGGVEQYSFRDTDTATKRARIVAVLDGAAVPNVSVTLVTRDPSNAVVDTDVATTSSAGEASGTYRPGNGAATGTYTTAVTSVSASWISWSGTIPPDNALTRTYTVTA